MQFQCDICKAMREDKFISICKKPILFLGQKLAEQNTRYCNDKPECLEGAKTFFLTETEDDLERERRLVK